MIKNILVVSEESQEYTAIHQSFVDGFVSNGCKTEVFLAPTYPTLIQKLSGKIAFLKAYQQKQNGKLLKRYTNLGLFDAIFVLKGSFISAESLQEIKAQYPEVKLLCFNPDSPFNKRVSPKSCRDIIPYCDGYYYWSKAGLESILNEGAKKAVYLPFATDTKRIYPVKSTEGYKYEVSFVGQGDKERNEQIDLYATYMFKHCPSAMINLFGIKWKVTNENICIHPEQVGVDFLKTIYQSKININLLRLQNKNSINMRTFEIPGAGGFMLHEISEEAKELFIEDKEAVYFSTEEEFFEKVDFYLKNESLRQKIALKGYEKAKSYNYSYQQRAATIINTF
jgi:spore maturation protein CgeB